MKLFILNKSLQKIPQFKNSIYYFMKNKDDFSQIQQIINEKKPNAVISVDFGIPTSNLIKNNSIIVAKETVKIDSKPIEWATPKEDRWIETDKELNKSICEILDKHCFSHYVASGTDLEFNKGINKRQKAKDWINKNLNASFIDNSSGKINLLEFKNNTKLSIIRIIHSNVPIESNIKSNFMEKIKFFLINFIFYKIKAKESIKKITNKKFIEEISKIK